MASPVAVLAVLVHAKGVQATNAQLKSVQGQLAATGAAAGASGGKMAAAGATMRKATKVGALGGIALGVAAAKMATNFDQAMVRVQTQAGASGREVKAMRGEVLKLAKQSEFAPVELADGLFRVESAGFRGKKALDVLTKAEQLASVGGSDLEATTNAVTSAMNSKAKGTKTASKVVGTLNAAIGQGNMRMEDMVGALSTGILPAAKGFGLSLRDVTSALGVMTRAGTPAQAAATRLRMTFSLMGAPTGKAAAALESIGLESDELAKAMHKPDGLVRAVTLLRDHLDGLSKVKQAEVIAGAFGGGRSSAAITALVQNVDTLGNIYDATGRKAGEFAEAVRIQDATPAEKFGQAWNRVKVTMIELGAKIAPKAATEFEHLSKILANPALTDEEKFSQIAERISQNFSKAIPVIAENAAKAAPKVAAAFARGFAAADIWGKLAIGGFIAWKLGAFRVLGAKAGAAWGSAFATTSAATAAAAPVAAGKVILPAGVSAGAGAAAGTAAGAGFAAGFRAKLATGLRAAFSLKGLSAVGVGTFLFKGFEQGFKGGFDSGFASRVLDAFPGRSIGTGIGDKIKDGLGLRASKGGLAQDVAAEIDSAVRAAKQRKGAIEAALDFGSALQRNSGKWRSALDAMVQKLNDLPAPARKAGRETADQIIDNLHRAGVIGDKEARKLHGGVAESFEGMRRSAKRSTRATKDAVGGIMRELGSTVTGAMVNMGVDVNKMLVALGAKPAKFGVTAGSIGKGVLKRAGGGYVGRPGQKGRDTVPAMLGKGEAVLTGQQQAVVNSSLAATHGMGLPQLIKSVNAPHYLAHGGFAGGQQVQHFAHGGGGIVPIPGFPGERAAKSVLPVAMPFLRKFKLLVTDAFGPGHKSAGHTVHGSSFDVVPGPGGSWDLVDAAVAAARGAGYNVLYNGVAGHGRGHHAHIEFGSGGRGLADIGELAKRKLTGPAGALRDFGQAGLDKVHEAATKFLSNQAGGGGASEGFEGAGSWQEIMGQIASAKGWNAGDWSELVRRESGGNPAARNPSSGAFGLGQFLGSTAQAYAKYGALSPDGSDQIRAMAKYIEDRYGTPSQALAFHNVNNWYKRGGFIGGDEPIFAATGMPPEAAAAAKRNAGKAKPKRKRDEKARKIKRLKKLASGLGTLIGDRNIDGNIQLFEQVRGQIEKQLEPAFGLMVDQFDLTDEEALVRLPDGSEIVNWEGMTLGGKFVRGVSHRVAELEQMIAKKAEIRDLTAQLIDRARVIVAKIEAGIEEREQRRALLHERAAARWREYRDLREEKDKLDQGKHKTPGKKKRLDLIGKRSRVLREDLLALTGQKSPSRETIVSANAIKGGSIGQLNDSLGRFRARRREWRDTHAELPFEHGGHQVEIERYRNEMRDLRATVPSEATPPTEGAGEDGPDISALLEKLRIARGREALALRGFALLGQRHPTLDDLPFAGTFHRGGRVPGFPGQEVLALLQSGEEVRSREEVARGGDTTTHNTFEIHNYDGHLDEQALAARVGWLLANA